MYRLFLLIIHSFDFVVKLTLLLFHEKNHIEKALYYLLHYSLQNKNLVTWLLWKLKQTLSMMLHACCIYIILHMRTHVLAARELGWLTPPICTAVEGKETACTTCTVCKATCSRTTRQGRLCWETGGSETGKNTKVYSLRARVEASLCCVEMNWVDWTVTRGLSTVMR